MIKINLIEHLSHGRDEVGPEITLLGMGFGSGSCGLGSGSLGLAPTSPAHGYACPGHLVPPRVGHGWHTDAQQPMSHLSSSTQLQEGTMPAPWQGWPLAGGSTAARAHHAQTVVAPSRRFLLRSAAARGGREQGAKQARPDASRGAANCL